VAEKKQTVLNFLLDSWAFFKTHAIENSGHCWQSLHKYFLGQEKYKSVDCPVVAVCINFFVRPLILIKCAETSKIVNFVPRTDADKY
jgi:hypothetical protein